MKQLLVMLNHYIESVDDENFLTTIMLEKDYSGRDTLKIAVELELIQLVCAPKVEAVIKRIYNSDYKIEGTNFEMSTSYQIVFTQKNQISDIESQNRFYKYRDISDSPQSEW